MHCVSELEKLQKKEVPTKRGRDFEAELKSQKRGYWGFDSGLGATLVASGPAMMYEGLQIASKFTKDLFLSGVGSAQDAFQYLVSYTGGSALDITGEGANAGSSASLALQQGAYNSVNGHFFIVRV